MKRKRLLNDEESTSPTNKKVRSEACDYFSPLPTEIKVQILSYIDEADPFQLRLVSTDFFELQNISSFQIGWISRTEMTTLIDHFARYQKPIGLQFLKAKNLGSDSISQIARLTQLTSLQVYPTTRAPEYLTILTALERLVGVDIADGGTSKLTNLTSLDTNYFHRHVFPKLRQLTIHRDIIGISSTKESIYDSLLTSLELLKCKESELRCASVFINRFQNLKRLVYDSDYYNRAYTLNLEIPTLESLMSTVEIQSFNGLTNLTELYLPGLRFTENNIHEIQQLTKLKVLNVPTLQRIPWNLAALTNLESLSCHSLSDLTFDIFAPNRLTALDLHSSTSAEEVAWLAQFTALRRLRYERPISKRALPISDLTNLTDLNICVGGSLPNLSRLTALQSRKLFQKDLDLDLSNFCSLTRLCVYDFNNTSLRNLTNLKSLELSDFGNSFQFDQITTLWGLTSLACRHGFRVDWAGLTNLSLLQSLSVGFVTQNVMHLLRLTHLTTLELHCRPTDELPIDKGYLSQLQRLQEVVISKDLSSSLPDLVFYDPSKLTYVT